MPAMRQQPPLQLQPSRHFAAWLGEAGISLAFTTYQTNRLFLVGLKEDGGLSVFERRFDRPMGLGATPERLYMNTRWQLWELADALPPGVVHEGADRLYVPRRAHTTGDLDVHDISVDRLGRIVFVNTAYSCLATVSDRYSFTPLWQPPFISRLAPEDRCHLNGLAMQDGEPAYVSTVSRSDVVAGWRERRHEGGAVIDVRAGEVVAGALSMPHSPRVYQDRLWLLSSGTGELGWLDRQSGRFDPVAFCPGYIRGLAFWGDHAIVGLSKPRRERAFSGLVLDDRLREKDAEARCGIWVVDLKTGVIAHWLELEGVVIELYDVQVLVGVRRPKAIGFKTDEIERLITIDAPGRPIFQALATKAAASGVGGPPPANPPVAAARDAAAADAEYRAANAFLQAGRLEEAVERYRAALGADPAHVKALANLGTVHARLGRPDDAVECYRRALDADPDSVIAHRNLAGLLEARGDAANAIRHYAKAVAIAPDDASLLNLLGLALYQDGRLAPAKDAFERAIRAAPTVPEGYNHLAAVLRIEERFDEALALHERALALDPSFVVARENIARLHEDRGRTDEARAAYACALAGRRDPALELHAALLCPPVFPSTEALDAYRARAEEAIDAAAGRAIPLAPERVQSSRCEPPFEWAYHGRDNARLKRKYAALFRPSFPAEPLERRPSADGPWRVGFVVTPGHEGVFARCMGGILNQLDAARFEIVIAVSRARAATLRGDLASPAIRHLNLPLRFDRAVATLRAAQLDVLYLWEVGTDASNYFLPFLRLAPVQVTGWGWPETSGAPELDAHVTSAALAPPGTEARFIEPLVRLPHLPSCLPPPPIPDRPHPPSHFGLPERARRYVCAQNLRKMHPDFDMLVGAILRRDPGGVAVFVADTHTRPGELLQARWATTLPDVRHRLALLPRLPPEEYFHLLAGADVMLDPLHFGGALTTYDALGVGTPLVTLPGDQPRGRVAGALCELVGVADACVAATAEAYVERAVRLATDGAWRSEVTQRIRDGATRIFARRAAAEQFAELLVGAVRAARG